MVAAVCDHLAKFFRVATFRRRHLRSNRCSDAFDDGSADSQAEYLSDGINESLVNKLSQLPGLRVKARSAVSRFQGRQINPQQVGRDLGVEAVLVGKVAQRGNSLIVQAELVRVADGAHIWGENYDRPPADILAVQEEVARKIVDALHLKLTGAEKQQLSRRYTENIEAYNLYLKGRYHERQFTEEAVKSGIGYFREAIEKDSNYALAYSGLSDSYVALATYYFLRPRGSQGAPAAERAVELDETLAKAHVSLARCAQRRLELAGLREKRKPGGEPIREL